MLCKACDKKRAAVEKGKVRNAAKMREAVKPARTRAPVARDDSGRSPIGRVIAGIVFIVGGFSGELVLNGTNSSMALVAVGAGLLLYGIFAATRD